MLGRVQEYRHEPIEILEDLGMMQEARYTDSGVESLDPAC